MEMIHPGGWFPAGHSLPSPLPPETEGDDVPAAASPAERAALLLDRAAAARARMAWDAALAKAEVAASAALEARDGTLYAAARNEQACIHLLRGELGKAEEACGLTPRNGEAPGQRARTLVNYAVAAGLGGDADGALTMLAEAEGLLAPADEHGRMLVGVNRARALAARGETAQADRAASEALRGARRAKMDEHGNATALMAAGLAALARGSSNTARQRLGDASRGFARSGDLLRQIQCHHVLGEIAYGGEDPIRAGAHYRDGLGIARDAGAQEAIELLTLRFEHR